MVERTAEKVLDELHAVVDELAETEAARERLIKHRDALAAEAWSMGATQSQVGDIASLSQAQVSRLVRAAGEAAPAGRPRADAGERARLERLDPDLLAEIMRTTVADAVILLARLPGRQAEAADLGRRARRPQGRDPQARIDLILRARTLLAEANR